MSTLIGLNPRSGPRRRNTFPFVALTITAGAVGVPDTVVLGTRLVGVRGVELGKEMEVGDSGVAEGITLFVATRLATEPQAGLETASSIARQANRSLLRPSLIP